jgi:glucose-fructose oxidoreductase
VTLQTRAEPAHVKVPVDVLPAGRRNPVEYVLARLDDGAPIEGPLDPALCLIGQRIIDSATLSARTKRTVPLMA